MSEDTKKLPMQCMLNKVPDAGYGTHEFCAEALQPADCPLLMEWSTDLVNWETLGWWGAYFEAQSVFCAVVTRCECGFIRATPMLAESSPTARTSLISSSTQKVPPGWTRVAPPTFPGLIRVEPPFTMTQLKSHLAARGTPTTPPMP